MSIISGFVKFSVPLNLVQTPADVVSSFPISVYKGTYMISVFIEMVCQAVGPPITPATPQGVLVSLQTTNAVPPAPTNDVIITNSSVAGNATNTRPSGATSTQDVLLQTEYTFPEDTTCYLRVCGNLGPGETFGLTSAGVVNTVTFVQIA